MKLNLDKMRRNVSRNTPDSVWKTFDLLQPGAEAEYRQWCSDFARAMAMKHGLNLKETTIYLSEMEDQTVRAQIVATLHKG